MRWLVVDDEPDCRTLFIIMLKRVSQLSIESLEFNDGLAAGKFIDQIDAGEILDNDLPEAVFTGYMMPAACGDYVAKRVRQSPRIGHIPIILSSAGIPTHDKDFRAYLLHECGVTLLMHKPFHPRTVLENLIHLQIVKPKDD